MARILLVVAALAVTIYALADWAARSRTWTPGRVNRWVWLAVIVLIPAIGPLAWIITVWVTRAEQDRYGIPPENPTATRPDDDPQIISDLADRLARRERRSPRGRSAPPTEPEQKSKDDGEDDEDEGNASAGGLPDKS